MTGLIIFFYPNSLFHEELLLWPNVLRVMFDMNIHFKCIPNISPVHDRYISVLSAVAAIFKVEIVVPSKKISSLEECHSYPKVVLALAILLDLLAISFLCALFNLNISIDNSQLLLDICIEDDIL